MLHYFSNRYSRNDLCRLLILTTFFWLTAPAQNTGLAADINVSLQYQVETALHTGRFHTRQRNEAWKPAETAIIVCDVWDYHHSLNAVNRLKEFAPRLNAVLSKARASGVTIIHSPSDCMAAYADHSARKRAMAAPSATRIPHDCKAWCSKIPSEEAAVYPIDQADGGADDNPAENAKWAAKLKAMGRNPGLPWEAQSEMITIDEAKDYISDKGHEVWNVLEQKGIRNVVLTGVHTNMCVLGRPFGLRQMARNGKNVVLMRDMTDTMYNPKSWPFVSHFTGTDFIVSHIERYVCPTMTSDQMIGGQPFRFQKDTRPHLVMLIAEKGYRTNESLPVFARDYLGRDFRVTMLFADAHNRNRIPGIDVVKDADVLLVSVRRRLLPEKDLQLIRDHVANGKPVVGIRTASHAFCVTNQPPPGGHSEWPEFDAQVFGGHYTGHHPGGSQSLVKDVRSDVTSNVKLHDPHGAIKQILNPLPLNAPRAQSSHLYKTSPLAKGTTVLTTGKLVDAPNGSGEPVTWAYVRGDGGRSFYSSMGHVDDFDSFPHFNTLLYRGICWASRVTPTEPDKQPHWQLTNNNPVPGKTPHWYRCTIRLPGDWTTSNRKIELKVPGDKPELDVYVNGEQLTAQSSPEHGRCTYMIPQSLLQPQDPNLIAVRTSNDTANDITKHTTLTSFDSATNKTLPLNGTWQVRHDDDPSFANIPLPAKFGASPNILFTPPLPLWKARPVTMSGLFTMGIEGPACDSNGNVFAVNFEQQGTIGRVSPLGLGEVFVTLPEGSVGNGIRFDRDGNFFVADYTKHNILKVNVKKRSVETLAHNDRMNQPNDIAIAPDGTLYASDPAWEDGTGQLWLIDMNGNTTLLAENMGTTNGIEVSPDGNVLYVNESVQRNVWAFDITSNKTLANKRLIRKFADHGFDGMRCDIDGNLYITRHGKGTVVKMIPAGKVLQEIDILGTRPSNLCFGGPDGRTVYVTEVDNTRLVSFRVDRPGRSWTESSVNQN